MSENNKNNAPPQENIENVVTMPQNVQTTSLVHPSIDVKTTTISKIPEDFLRTEPSHEPIPIDLAETRQNDTIVTPPVQPSANIIDVDEMLARELQLQEQQAQFVPAYTNYTTPVPANVIGCLNVNVVQAQLNKSYGLVRMDPYVKVRIGNCLFETTTDTNGSTSPSWGQTVSGYLAKGIASIFVEIFDERSFTEDEKIAWASVSLPARLFQNEAVDEWYPLSGKLGPDMEGKIHLLMTLTSRYAPPANVLAAQRPPQPYVPVGTDGAQPPVGMQNNPPPPLNPMTVQAYKDIISRLKEMFPTLDEEIIASVFEGHSRLEGPTINALLALNE